MMGNLPFLSSIVTVSLAHFIRNLPCAKGSAEKIQREPSRELSLCHDAAGRAVELT